VLAVRPTRAVVPASVLALPLERGVVFLTPGSSPELIQTEPNGGLVQQCVRCLGRHAGVAPEAVEDLNREFFGNRGIADDTGNNVRDAGVVGLKDSFDVETVGLGFGPVDCFALGVHIS